MSNKTQKIRVLLDLDGVIRNFVDGLIQIYRQVYPDHEIDFIGSRNLEDFFPIGMEIYSFIDEHREEILVGAPEYAGAIEAMHRWSDQFEPVIVTAQPRDWKYYTFIWLGEHRVPTNEIHICFQKHRIDGVAILEDFVDNLEAFRATGRLAVCIDRPWNQSWDGPRVHSVDAFFELVWQTMNQKTANIKEV